MATTTRKATAKTSAAKAAEMPATMADETDNRMPTVAAVKEPKKFKPDDMVPCRSNVVGLLLYNGHKTSLPYQWSNMGDISYIAYQDILAAFMVNSAYIFDPLFIIEDEDVLEDPRFSRVKDVYDNMYDAADIDKLLELSPAKFEKVLKQNPIGLRNAVKAKIGGLLVEGNFDSIQKVRIIDELCGTDFRSMM